MNPIQPTLCKALSLSIAAGITASAATLEWIGPDNGAWGNGDNWAVTGDDADGLPDADDDVVLGAGASGKTINATATATLIKSLTFAEAASSPVLVDATGQYFDVGTAGSITVQAGSASHTIKATAVRINSGTSGSVFTIDNSGGEGNRLRIEGQLTQTGINTKSVTISGTGTVRVTQLLYCNRHLTANGTVETEHDITGYNGGLALLLGGGRITNVTATVRTLQVSAGNSGAYAGKIEGLLNLSKGRSNFTDGGTQSLTGDNTYSGTTAVNSGRLHVDGSHHGGGNYTVSGCNTESRKGPACLSGGGTITLAAGKTFLFQGYGWASGKSLATLDPGSGANAIDTLTVSGNSLTLGSHSRYNAQLGPDGVSDCVVLLAGTGNAGNLILGADSQLYLEGKATGAFGGSAYTILTHSGSRTGTFTSVTLDTGAPIDITAAAESGFDVAGKRYRLVYGANAIRLEPVTPGMLITVR